MAHEWSESTMEGYTWNICRFHHFAKAYGIMDPFSFNLPSSPPRHPSIPLYWNISRHTLEEHQKKGKLERVKYNRARQTRSAFHAFYGWISALCSPDTTIKTNERKILQFNKVVPSDSIIARMSDSGMSKRLGTNVTPSLAQLRRHIFWNQRHRTAIF